MTYEHFIKALKRYQTLHVKAVALPESCTPTQIPDAFVLLFPSIVALLEKHINQLCQTNQVLALFGLQPGSLAITSNAPLSLNRVVSKEHPSQHLCCSLAYLTAFNNEVEQIKTWQGSKTIMVDFTTGLVMDGEYYASLVFGEQPVGTIYGFLDSAKLMTVWNVLKHHRHYKKAATAAMTLLAA